MKRYLIILVLTYSFSILSLPARYQRFILTDQFNRSIKKAVDIYYDRHIELRHPKTGFGIEDVLVNEEYTNVERVLRDTLVKLEEFSRNNPIVSRTGQKQHIDLIWEISKEQVERFKEEAQQPFLLQVGTRFAEQFEKSKNSFIQFVFGDDFRGEDEGIFYLESFITIEEVISAINWIKEEGPLHLNDIKESVTPQFHTQLLHDWDSYNAQLDTLLATYLYPSRDKTLGDIIHNEKFKKEWNDVFVLLTVDIEMLIKVLSSKNIRTILYAGGAHSEWVAEKLQAFGFKKIVDIGIVEIKDSILQFAHLNSNGISFLLKTPSVTQPKVISLLSPQIVSALKVVEKEAWIENTMSENVFMKHINTIIEQAQKAYIDIANMQLSSMYEDAMFMPIPKNLQEGMIQQEVIVAPTLLHMAVKNNFDKAVEKLINLPHSSVDIQTMQGTPLGIAVSNYIVGDEIGRKNAKHIIDLLINKSPNLDLPDINGKTPLHVAVQGNALEIIQFLLERGADPNIPDVEGRIPLSIAQSQPIIDLLKRHGALAVEPVAPVVEEIIQEIPTEMPPLVD